MTTIFLPSHNHPLILRHNLLLSARHPQKIAYFESVGNSRFSDPARQLLDRASGRAELLLSYSSTDGYELRAGNYSAFQLFGIEEHSLDEQPLSWNEFPKALAHYLSQALALVSGLPEQSMPEYRPDESSAGLHYIAKLYYQLAEDEEEHWYLFCFHNSVNWLENTQQAVNQHKLETIGELASGVAHDFNNLIMGIQSNAEAMLPRSHLDDPDRDTLINIIRACTAGASLTRSLLGYAKKQPLTLSRINIIDLVHDVARIAGLPSGRHITIALGPEFLEKSEPMIAVACYSSVSHCLLNLIKNAREAMPEGGTIKILWEGDETTSTITVQDEGTGISEKDLAQIFEPFYSTKKKGTGLGLAMVRGIMSQHAGQVKIRSALGAGTSISLVWPRFTNTEIDHAPAAPGDTARKSTQHILKQTARIVLEGKRSPAMGQPLAYVVDDDDLVREGLCSLLQHLGYQIKSFSKPEEALQTLIATKVPPKIVIVDYNMPGMTGAQFITKYSETTAQDSRHSAVQVLLMSGLPPSHFQEFMADFDHLHLGILEKPFSLETLRKKLANIKSVRRLTTSIGGIPLNRPVPRPNAQILGGEAKSSEAPRQPKIA